MFDLYCKETF